VSDIDGIWIDCWQCGGVGMTAGCFEDCCSGADCDPEDADLCCWPNTCDVCHGKGGWEHVPEKKPNLPDATDEEARATLLRAAGIHEGEGK
jgi:hypothetical protein